MPHSVPSNRKARIASIRDPKTSQQLLIAIHEADNHVDIKRALVKNEECPPTLLWEIYEWSAQAGNSKWGPHYENSFEPSKFPGLSPQDEYDAYQNRLSVLSDFFHRESLPSDLAEKIAGDKRIDQGPSYLADKGFLSDETIIEILETRPECREYFYVFLKNPTPKVREKLLDLVISTQNQGWLESFKLHVALSESEEMQLHLGLKIPVSDGGDAQELNEHELREQHMQIWTAMCDEMAARIIKFYEGGLAEFVSGNKLLDRQFRFKFENLIHSSKPLSEIMEEIPEDFRAEYYRFHPDVRPELLREAARDDYYYACFMLASRAELDFEAAEILFSESERVLKFAIASNESFPYERAVEALDHPDPTVRIGFAQRGAMHARDLIRVLRDPVPAVAETPYNENRLHISGGFGPKLLSGTETELLTLATEFNVFTIEQIAREIKALETPESVKALNALANSISGNRRVALMRPHWSPFVHSSISEHAIVKLAGDKLPQVRKYVIEYKVSRSIRQMDYLRLILDSDYSDYQKSLLAAGITDRKEFNQLKALRNDTILLGLYLNWKAAPSELKDIFFESNEIRETAHNLRTERDAVSGTVSEQTFLNLNENPENPWEFRTRSILEMSVEEQDEYWGGAYPRFFKAEVDQ